MKDLIFKGENGQALTSSLLVAEKFKKEHKHVLSSIRELMRTDEISALPMFEESMYVNEQNKEQPMFIMNRDGFTLLAMGFTGKKAMRFKLDYINAFNKMEEALKSMRNTYQIPQSFSEALMLAAKQAEQIESQQKQIQAQSNQIAELEKQTEYTRVILQSKSTALVTQIAQDYGMSARKFNAILRDLNIQHKVRNQWVLFGKYLNKGYVQSSTFNFTRSDGREDVSMTTEWTQKGRMFLYNTLKANNILPLIEQ